LIELSNIDKSILEILAMDGRTSTTGCPKKASWYCRESGTKDVEKIENFENRELNNENFMGLKQERGVVDAPYLFFKRCFVQSDNEGNVRYIMLYKNWLLLFWIKWRNL